MHNIAIQGQAHGPVNPVLAERWEQNVEGQTFHDYIANVDICGKRFVLASHHQYSIVAEPKNCVLFHKTMELFTQIVYSYLHVFFDIMSLQIWPLVNFTAILKQKIHHSCFYFPEALFGKLKHVTITMISLRKVI